MENNVYGWLISELTKANEQLSTMWNNSLTEENCDSLDIAQSAIVSCISIIKRLKEENK
jgi:hypothetical protein